MLICTTDAYEKDKIVQMIYEHVRATGACEEAPIEARIMAALTFKKTRGARIRSIYAHDEKKELRSDELDTLRRSRNPPVILTVNGRGYSCEWVSGQKTKGDQRGEDDFMQNGQLRAIRRQHRHRRICLQQVHFKSEVANLLHECGADHPQKPVKKLERGMTVEMRSQMIQRTQHCMHPHTFLRTQIRNVLRKSYRNQNQSSTVFIFTSKQTEIAKSSCEPN